MMADSPVSSEQQARLLELEARQQQLKRLCEEALKEDEEHQHIFQQLEEHNMASSTVGSCRGVVPASAAATITATQAGRSATFEDPMDDLMTGEVRSFRDPNSITRASSTGSIVGNNNGGGGGAAAGGFSYPRNSSMDRPTMSRLDSAYRPPMYPTVATGATTTAPIAGYMPPPPPPRASLSSTSRLTRAYATTSYLRKTFTGIPSPVQSSSSAAAAAATVTTTGSSSIPPSWRRNDVAAAEAARPPLTSPQRSGGDTNGIAGATTPVAAPLRSTVYTSPLPSSVPRHVSYPAAPPPPPPERSRSPSHSVPLTDRYQSSGDHHLRTTPPPPPPSSSSYAAAVTRASSYSMKYERATQARNGLKSPSAAAAATHLPPPPSSSNLLSPDEVTDNLPSPPPLNRGAYLLPESRSSASVKYRSAPVFLARDFPMPPPPPPPLMTSPSFGASTPPPPPVGPEDTDGDSFLSTTSTERDLARWRHLSHRSDTNLQRGGNSYATSTRPTATKNTTATTAPLKTYDGLIRGSKGVGSWAKMQNHFIATQNGLDRRVEAAATNSDSRRPTRGSPPPPPPPAEAIGMPPPPPTDDNDYLSSRWETVSLTPDLKRAEESRLRHFFAPDEKVSPRPYINFIETGNRTSPSKWRAAGSYRGRQGRQGRQQQSQPQQQRQQYAPSTHVESGAASVSHVPTTDRTVTVLQYDSSIADETSEMGMLGATATPPLASPAPPLPPPEAEQQPTATLRSATAAAPSPATKAKKNPSHPYGGQPTTRAKDPAVPQLVTSTATASPAVAPLFSTMLAQQHRNASAGINSSRNPVWENDEAAQQREHAQYDLSGEAGGATAQPLAPAAPAAVAAASTVAGAGFSDFFDMGPEKEALLTLLRESTRAAAAAITPAPTPAAAAPVMTRQQQQPDVRSEVSPSVPQSEAAPASFAFPIGVSTTTPHHHYTPSTSDNRNPIPARPTREVNTAPSVTSLKSPRCSSNASRNIGPFPEPSRDTSAVPPPPRDSAPSGTSKPSHDAATTADSTVAKRQSPQRSSTVDCTTPQLQRQCEEAQAKAEALARHLVKAISDRKRLQGNVEELEQLVEECNAEVGRLQQIVEEQHQDTSTSLGVQAALRAKEREVAVYEDEIRRLNGVLDEHLSRTSATKHMLREGISQSLITKEAEIEAAMAEVGMAHLAQRDAEERASQLANELETAVEQIQFLDERLAEMERAAAAAQFENANTCIRGAAADALTIDNLLNSPRGGGATLLAIPPPAETRHWPVEARRAIAQLVAQAQGLLQQNAEGERHAAARLQHMEHTCQELQQLLRQRSEEVSRTQEVCQQLRQEKSALQACGEQWYLQLRDVKEDAQLVSEMMRTSRVDAEDVYLSSRVAEQRAAAAAANPLCQNSAAAATTTTASAVPVVDVATLQKSAQFAQQVMGDFHAVARFLSSLRKMDIGDRNGYQILQSIAKGCSPAEGLFITTDDDATPKRMTAHLSVDATTEARRRVEEKKARVLQAVEHALKLDKMPDTPLALQNTPIRGDTPAAAPVPVAPCSVSERPPVEMPLGLPPRAEAERSVPVVKVVTASLTPGFPARQTVTRADEVKCGDEPDAFLGEDETPDELEPEMEVVTAPLQPPRRSSYSYRGGSSGMVHSDLRLNPVDLGPSMSYNSSQATSLTTHEQSSAKKSFATTAIATYSNGTIGTAAPAASAKVYLQQQHSSSLLSATNVMPTFPIPLSANGKPICTTLYMGKEETEPPTSPTAFTGGKRELTTATEVTAAPIVEAITTAVTATATAPASPPPPSVSRPLRLSATPSQPQSEVKEEKEVSHVVQRSVIEMGDVLEEVEMEKTMQSNVLTAQSTPFHASVGNNDHCASTITVVSSPSVTPQVSEHPAQQPQQQQQQSTVTAKPMHVRRPIEAQRSFTVAAPVPSPSLARAIVTAAVMVGAPPLTPPTEDHTLSVLDDDATLPSVSDIEALEESVTLEPQDTRPTRPSPLLHPQNQLHSPLKEEAPLLARLRSPTPDGPMPQREITTATDEPLILTDTPLERPRPSQSSVDEPPPRPTREESQLSQPDSHPKARSTTARPPSTPPAPLHNNINSTQLQANNLPNGWSKSYRSYGARRAASNDSNNDEATLFFREPPCGVVHEAMPVVSTASTAAADPVLSDDRFHSTESELRVEVDLLCGDFVMPSSQSVTNAPAAAGIAATDNKDDRHTNLFPPPRTPTTPVKQVKSTTTDAESVSGVAHLAPRRCTSTEAETTKHTFPLHSRSTSSNNASKKELASTATTTTAVTTKTSTRDCDPKKLPNKERSSLLRSRRVIDEDDEPSLQFSAPPPLPPPAALPRSASATTSHEMTSNKNGSPGLTAEATTASFASQEPSPSSASLPFAQTTQQQQQLHCGPGHRPPHQPRRPQSIDISTGLFLVSDGVAPPRLQRSASTSPSMAAPLTNLSVPSPAGLSGTRADIPKHSSQSSSIDRTPALAEPQRASPASRADNTETPSSTATATTAAAPAVVATSKTEEEPVSFPPVLEVHEVVEYVDAAEPQELEEEEVRTIDVRSGTATPNRATTRPTTADVPVASATATVAGGVSRVTEVATALAVTGECLANSGSKTNCHTLYQTPDHRPSSGAATATPGSLPKSESLDSPHSAKPRQPRDDIVALPALEVSTVGGDTGFSLTSSGGFGLPHEMRSDVIGSFSTNLSQPADPLPAAPGPSREANRSSRDCTMPRLLVQGGMGSDEPAPLPTVNVDVPESNTLGLRRASPKPSSPHDLSLLQRGTPTQVVTDAVLSLPSSLRSHSARTPPDSRSNSAVNSSPKPEATMRRREDVTRILERIRAKREQEQKSGVTTPTTVTAASPTSSSRDESEDQSFTAE